MDYSYKGGKSNSKGYKKGGRRRLAAFHRPVDNTVAVASVLPVIDEHHVATTQVESLGAEMLQPAMTFGNRIWFGEGGHAGRGADSTPAYTSSYNGAGAYGGSTSGPSFVLVNKKAKYQKDAASKQHGKSYLGKEEWHTYDDTQDLEYNSKELRYGSSKERKTRYKGASKYAAGGGAGKYAHWGDDGSQGPHSAKNGYGGRKGAWIKHQQYLHKLHNKQAKQHGGGGYEERQQQEQEDSYYSSPVDGYGSDDRKQKNKKYYAGGGGDSSTTEPAHLVCAACPSKYVSAGGLIGAAFCKPCKDGYVPDHKHKKCSKCLLLRLVLSGRVARSHVEAVRLICWGYSGVV